VLPRSAYFSLFSVPDPARPDVPIPPSWPFPFSVLTRLPVLDQLLVAVEVNEEPLRFAVEVGERGGRLVAVNRVGAPAATVHIRWTPIPTAFRPEPGVIPPQTLLNPFSSQRFTMLDGRFRFADGRGSGFDGFGAGRTFPLFPRGLALRIGAVIDILRGHGRLTGVTGTVVVNGEIEPPSGLNLNLMVRLIDPPAGVVDDGPLPPLREAPFPDPSATFLTFLGESDPERPSRVRPVPGGWIYELHELLRTIDLDFAVLPLAGPRSRASEGEVVGRARTLLVVRPQATGPLAVQARSITLDFDRGDGAGGGNRVTAELVEGRGFDGGPASGGLLRFGAFGPATSGAGQFAGGDANLTVNGLLRTSPVESSNLYVLRVADHAAAFRPEGRP
jgi:hypothetical protein